MEKAKRVKVCCPECSKYFMASLLEDGSIRKQCPNCKVIVYIKERKGNEKLIKLKYVQ
ncbi:MAG: hypothetical protein IKI95_07430 [Clostridia bacterium]|nr:hypothetical protein [Clostridia bacterium]